RNSSGFFFAKCRTASPSQGCGNHWELTSGSKAHEAKNSPSIFQPELLLSNWPRVAGHCHGEKITFPENIPGLIFANGILYDISNHYTLSNTGH
ncbi:unnamed protein product, partial [Ixodes hexagonus]